MPRCCLIICDYADREVQSICQFVGNPFVLCTSSLSKYYLHNGVCIGSRKSYREMGTWPPWPNPSSVKSIYWRCLNPLPFLSSPQGPRNGVASVNLILRQYRQAKWFNSPAGFWQHINKPLQLEQIAQDGIIVPETLYTNSRSLAKLFINKVSKAIIKPISGGDYARLVDIDTCDSILDALLEKDHQECVPFTLQNFIRGINIRSYVIGGKVYSAKLISDLPDCRADSECVIAPMVTCSRLEELCFKVQQSLGLEWTAIDWIYTGDDFVFLEANFSPMFYNFQIATGYSIAKYLATELSV